MHIYAFPKHLFSIGTFYILDNFFLLFECLIGLTQVTFLSVRVLWTARLMFSALSIHSLTQGSCKTTCGNKYSQPALLSHFLPNRSEQEIEKEKDDLAPWRWEREHGGAVLRNPSLLSPLLLWPKN